MVSFNLVLVVLSTPSEEPIMMAKPSECIACIVLTLTTISVVAPARYIFRLDSVRQTERSGLHDNDADDHRYATKARKTASIECHQSSISA